MSFRLNPFTGNFDQVLDKAQEIKYTNGGLTATEVGGALDEIVNYLDQVPIDPNIIAVTTATYSAAVGNIYACNRAGTINITLPLASGVTSKQLIVKDTSGAAESNTITVTASGGALIDGSATQTITSNYGALKLISDGTNWLII